MQVVKQCVHREAACTSDARIVSVRMLSLLESPGFNCKASVGFVGYKMYQFQVSGKREKELLSSSHHPSTQNPPSLSQSLSPKKSCTLSELKSKGEIKKHTACWVDFL